MKQKLLSLGLSLALVLGLAAGCAPKAGPEESPAPETSSPVAETPPAGPAQRPHRHGSGQTALRQRRGGDGQPL